MAPGRSAKDGGQRRDRTADTRIFSPLLYQLSYLAPIEEAQYYGKSVGCQPGVLRGSEVAVDFAFRRLAGPTNVS